MINIYRLDRLGNHQYQQGIAIPETKMSLCITEVLIRSDYRLHIFIVLFKTLPLSLFSLFAPNSRPRARF